MLYAIIGNGAAGTEAVKAIRSRDTEGEIILIDADPNRCYYRPMLPDYVCGLKKKESLWVVDEGFYRSNRVDFRAGIRVEEVLPQEGKLRSDDGEEVRFDRLLLACGSAPRRLDCPGAELEGVVYLRTLEQAERIKELAAGAKQAVAVGGGLLGVELARLFNELGLKTTYLLREDRFWPQMLDEVGSALVERRLAEKGIRVLKQEGVQEIGGRGGKVRELHTTQGKSIPAELVGVAIGVVPSVGFLEGSGIDAGGGVIVDQRLQSNSEGVFAAGDAARAYDPVHGEHRVNTSWMGAQRSGRIAGLNMAGGEEELPGSIAFNLINIYGLPVACLGLNLAEGEGYQSLYGDYPKGDVYKKYVLRDGRLVGATLIGDVAEARTLEELITAGADLGGVKERLFEEGFDLRSAARGLLGG